MSSLASYVQSKGVDVLGFGAGQAFEIIHFSIRPAGSATKLCYDILPTNQGIVRIIINICGAKSTKRCCDLT